MWERLYLQSIKQFTTNSKFLRSTLLSNCLNIWNKFIFIIFRLYNTYKRFEACSGCNVSDVMLCNKSNLCMIYQRDFMLENHKSFLAKEKFWFWQDQASDATRFNLCFDVPRLCFSWQSLSRSLKNWSLEANFDFTFLYMLESSLSPRLLVSAVR